MKYGICLLSLIPQRFEPSEKSEMVNQLLFGDLVSILETNKNWIKIVSEYDGYEGWVDSKMLTTIDEEYYLKLKEQKPFVNNSTLKIINSTKNSFQHLSPGCSIYNLSENSFKLGDMFFTMQEKLGQLNDIEVLAKQFLNAPYLWGGKSIFGIDCSGFVQVIFKILGITLPRDASDQSETGKPIGFVQETKTGDLAFFDNEEGKIIHVGILLDNQTIIHASGFVRIDRIDSHGIFNSDLNDYSHKLRIIKRM